MKLSLINHCKGARSDNETRVRNRFMAACMRDMRIARATEKVMLAFLKHRRAASCFESLELEFKNLKVAGSSFTSLQRRQRKGREGKSTAAHTTREREQCR